MKVVLILGAIILLAIVSTASHLARHRENVENVIAPITIPTQSDEANSDIKLVLLALRPEGFETNEMQLDAGEYLFIIGNRTGLRDVNVRLDREGNERVAAATVGGRHRDLKQRLKLTPGTYLVTANDNPEWTCRIVVGP